jgi:hypothetical protein
MIPVLGTSCGLLAAAAFTGGLRPAIALPEAGDATVTVARDAAESATDTAAALGGPLQMPEIGVVAPGFDERYAAALLSASQSSPAPAPVTPFPTPAPAGPSRPVEPPPTSPAPVAPHTSDDVTPRTGPSVTPPAEEPPAEEPPAEAPPAEKPPTQAPPTEAPPTEEPPTEAPPAEEPPAEAPPAEEPPAEEPPAEEPPAEEPPAEEPPVEEPPAEEPVEDVELALGETFDVLAASGQVAYSIVVDAVIPDVDCTADGNLPAENGHLIGVELRVVTGPAPVEGTLPPAISTSDFGFLDAEGEPGAEADTASAEACLDEEDFPSTPLAPEQETAGTVVLDVADVTGAITYRPEGISLLWRF